MRIGILTYHRSINYGAYMQSYALSNELSKRYPTSEVEIIDYEDLTKHNNYAACTHENILKTTIFKKKIIYKAFQHDLHILPLSPESFIVQGTTELCKYINSRYDIVVVGSDAVWAFNSLKRDSPYWLFGEDLKDVIKTSYAASAFSTKFDSVSKDDQEYLSSCLQSFSYIGVRDNATKSFIESMSGGKTVHLNHDPSLFLSPGNDKDRIEGVYRRNGILKDKKIVTMMLRHFPYMADLQKFLKAKGDFQFLFINHRNDVREDFFASNRKLLADLSPLDWYNFYSQATLNVSNYFHGCLLALVNHIPTLCVDDSTTNYLSKYSQVMTDMGLKDSLFANSNLNKDSFIERVDYLLENSDKEKQNIIEGIKKEREKSQSFFNYLDTIVNK